MIVIFKIGIFLKSGCVELRQSDQYKFKVNNNDFERTSIYNYEISKEMNEKRTRM